MFNKPIERKNQSDKRRPDIKDDKVQGNDQRELNTETRGKRGREGYGVVLQLQGLEELVVVLLGPALPRLGDRVRLAGLLSDVLRRRGGASREGHHRGAVRVGDDGRLFHAGGVIVHHNQRSGDAEPKGE